MTDPDTPAAAIHGTFLRWVAPHERLVLAVKPGIELAADDWPAIEAALNAAGYVVIKATPAPAAPVSPAMLPPEGSAAPAQPIEKRRRTLVLAGNQHG